MSKYRVKFYSGTGTNGYKIRQQGANRDGAVVYIEAHINSNLGRPGRYAMAIVGSNASVTSKTMGSLFVQKMSEEFSEIDAKKPPIQIGGNGNCSVRYTAMPAMLIESCFGNNPAHAKILNSISGRVRIAAVLARTIAVCFPEGGLVAFSVGHRRITNNSGEIKDWGCSVHNAPWSKDKGRYLAEADYCELILEEAKTILEAIP